MKLQQSILLSTFRAKVARLPLLCLVFVLMAGTTAALATPISGTVTDQTTKKPAVGDSVELMRLGMEVAAKTTTDARGRFTLDAADSEPMHLLRVTHDKATYFHPVPAGTTTVNVDVYDAAEKVAGVSTEADVARIEASPNGLSVIENFFVKNASSPPRTQFGPRAYEIYLPKEAQVVAAAAQGPGSMPVQTPPTPLGASGDYSFVYPLRPGETRFQVSYQLPYSGSFQFHPRVAAQVDNLAIIVPKSMQFTGTPASAFQPIDSSPNPAVSESTGQAIDLGAGLRTVQETLKRITTIDPSRLPDLLTEIKSFTKRLDAFSDNLANAPSLNVFSGHVDSAYARLKGTIGQSPDIILRRFYIGRDQQLPALLVCEDGLSDNQMIDQDTIYLLQRYEHVETLKENPSVAHQIIHDSVVSIGHATVETEWSKLIIDVMGGNTLVFIEGCTEVLVLDTVKYPARAISAPTTERAVKGPQEAFNEVILTQMNLIRRRIKGGQLHFDPLHMGELSHTLVVIAHVEGVANPALVLAVKERLASLKLANLEYSNTLASVLTENPGSLFPQVRSTERADIISRDLALGKVAILVDNTPYAMTVPATFMDFYQTTDDYTGSFWEGSLQRLVRFIGLFVGLLLPPLYVALVSVDPELLPTRLVITIEGSRLGIPFPPIFEVIIMWSIIEILREAAIRLPKGLSTTLGTVGAIVVGTAVVKAAIVSDLMIVIITLTALGLFTSPSYEMATPWRVLFWFVVGAAYAFGTFGIILAVVGIIAHLASLENFNVPYLSPFAPMNVRDLKDSVIRLPYRTLERRPSYLKTIRPVQRKEPKQIPMPDPPLVPVQQERLDEDL